MRGFFDSERPQYTLTTLGMRRLTADSHPEIFKLGPAPKDTSKEAPPENSRPQTWILVTESEIRDKSKGDTLGKLLTVLQTTWFIAQYLGRWTAHQPTTQLEVMTLAYAALNVAIYALWWDKPLDVQEPIDVRRGCTIPVDVRRKTLWGAWCYLGCHEILRSWYNGVRNRCALSSHWYTFWRSSLLRLVVPFPNEV